VNILRLILLILTYAAIILLSTYPKAYAETEVSLLFHCADHLGLAGVIGSGIGFLANRTLHNMP